MPRHLDTSTITQMAKIMVQYGRSSRSSGAKSVRSSFGRTAMGKAIRESSVEIRLEKSSELGVLVRTPSKPRKGRFLSVFVDDIKLAGKKKNISPTWTILMKDVDLGEPTSFFDHVYFGCTQRECKTSKILWTIAEICLNPGCQLEVQKICLIQKNPKQTFHLGPMIWKDM